MWEGTVGRVRCLPTNVIELNLYLETSIRDVKNALMHLIETSEVQSVVLFVSNRFQIKISYNVSQVKIMEMQIRIYVRVAFIFSVAYASVSFLHVLHSLSIIIVLWVCSSVFYQHSWKLISRSLSKDNKVCMYFTHLYSGIFSCTVFWNFPCAVCWLILTR